MSLRFGLMFNLCRQGGKNIALPTSTPARENDLDSEERS